MSEVKISSALAGQAHSLPSQSGIEPRIASSLRLVQEIRVYLDRWVAQMLLQRNYVDVNP